MEQQKSFTLLRGYKVQGAVESLPVASTDQHEDHMEQH